MADRKRLIEIVQRITDGDFSGDEVDELIAEFATSVLDPGALDVLFWSNRHFDHEPSPEEIVDRVLSYRPIEL